jgi:CheY-like chemotaxis protein
MMAQWHAEASNRRMLMRALGRLLPGFVLSEASDGEAALQRVMVRFRVDECMMSMYGVVQVDMKHWDLIILDSEMPVRIKCLCYLT